MKTIKETNYTSTYNFVSVNNLDKEAIELFGNDWEAEDDMYQIEQLINYIGLKFYTVEYLEDNKYDADIKVFYNELEHELDTLKDLLYDCRELLSFHVGSCHSDTGIEEEDCINKIDAVMQ